MLDLQHTKQRLIIDFTRKEKSIFDETAEKSITHFLESGRSFSQETFTDSMNLLQASSQSTQQEVKALTSLFKTFASDRGHVKHSQKILYGVARLHYQRALRRKYMSLLHNECAFKRYKKRLNNHVKRYYEYEDIYKQPIESVYLLAREEIRQEIKQVINKKSDLEIQKMQREYEGLITQMTGLLEKRLIELKVEEEQHRDLVQRYEGLAEKKPLQNVSRH